MCELSPNTTATEIEEERPGAALRQAPMEQTEVDGLLSPLSGNSNI